MHYRCHTSLFATVLIYMYAFAIVLYMHCICLFATVLYTCTNIGATVKLYHMIKQGDIKEERGEGR